MGNTLGAAFDHFYGITGGKALALLRKFRNEDFGFGLNVDQLSQLLDIEDTEVTASIMSSFDTQSSGTISGLDLLCGLLLVSRSDVDNKLEGVFKAFDFRDAGHITFDELVVLLQTVCVGLAVVSGSEDPLPDERQMEIVAAHAFSSAGKNVDLENRHHELVWATVSLKEFSTWAKASLQLSEDDVGEDVNMTKVLQAIDSILSSNIAGDADEAERGMEAMVEEKAHAGAEAHTKAEETKQDERATTKDATAAEEREGQNPGMIAEGGVEGDE